MARITRMVPFAQSASSAAKVCGRVRYVRGEMSEWFKEPAWKACVGVTPPWVRIPLSPLKRAAAAEWLWGAAQLEPENPARSGRKQRYWVNQCDAVSPGPIPSNEISGHRA